MQKWKLIDDKKPSASTSHPQPDPERIASVNVLNDRLPPKALLKLSSAPRRGKRFVSVEYPYRHAKQKPRNSPRKPHSDTRLLLRAESAPRHRSIATLLRSISRKMHSKTHQKRIQYCSDSDHRTPSIFSVSFFSVSLNGIENKRFLLLPSNGFTSWMGFTIGGTEGWGGV